MLCECCRALKILEFLRVVHATFQVVMILRVKLKLPRQIKQQGQSQLRRLFLVSSNNFRQSTVFDYSNSIHLILTLMAADRSHL